MEQLFFNTNNVTGIYYEPKTNSSDMVTKNVVKSFSRKAIVIYAVKLWNGSMITSKTAELSTFQANDIVHASLSCQFQIAIARYPSCNYKAQHHHASQCHI